MLAGERLKRPGSYQEAVQYIEELPRFTKKHTLTHTADFLRRLGDPANDKKVIHVAGTNGKGSVCAYIQAILEAEGKRTGFFTSPHLIALNERIQIGRKPISDEMFYRVFVEVYDTVRQMEEEGIEHPSYFEFLYGMGMQAFEEADVEYIILETGLGGRLDATNSFPCPALSIITSISLDHTDILGDTISQIAWEKAGIIKEGVPVFFDGSNGEASEVIEKTAGMRHAPCRKITKDAFKIREVNRKYIAFSRVSAYDKDTDWQVPICGIYQVMNAELAIEAAEYLLKDELKDTGSHADRWRSAVSSIRWKGRMEEAGERLVIDGAHNPGAVAAFVESVRALEESVGALEKEMPLPVILFSAAGDKKYRQMISYLCEHLPAKAYVVTEINDKRKVPASELQEIFREYTARPVKAESDVREALACAYKLREEGGYIYCLGSLYLAGQIEEILTGGDLDVELRGRN